MKARRKSWHQPVKWTIETWLKPNLWFKRAVAYNADGRSLTHKVVEVQFSTTSIFNFLSCSALLCWRGVLLIYHFPWSPLSLVLVRWMEFRVSLLRVWWGFSKPPSHKPQAVPSSGRKYTFKVCKLLSGLEQRHILVRAGTRVACALSYQPSLNV